MNVVLRRIEAVDGRVLAALRCVDPSNGTTITDGLVLQALEGRATFVRNASGLQVITFWSELPAHRDSFSQPPTSPPIGSRVLPIAIADRGGRYLPRIVSLPLPRDPSADANPLVSLFEPIVVPMYPGPCAPTGANWSLLRVSVSERDSGDALGGAWLRVHRDNKVIARGMTDGRGEALVAVVGVPVTSFGEEDDVVISAIPITLEARFDPTRGTRFSETQRQAGLTAPVPLQDPGLLDAATGLPRATLSLVVSARSSQNVSISVPVP